MLLIGQGQSASVLLYHVAEGKYIVVVDWRYCGHQLPFLQLFVLEGNTPVLLVAVVPESPLHHVEGDSNYVS
jgi:hypothetical protein